MERRCAIFMRADPLLKTDIETVKAVLKLYDAVDIILDRKWQKDKYELGYLDRADIIRHDFKDAGITQYRILANDTSRYDSVIKENVRNVAVELNSRSKVSEMYDRYVIARQMVPDLNIVMIPQFASDQITSQKMLFDLVEEDATHQLYKKYMSEYAYIKIKFRLMTKIGVTGNRGCGLGKVLETFAERDYDIIDVDQMLIGLFDDPVQVAKFKMMCERNGVRLKAGELLDVGTCLKANRDAVLRRCLTDEEAMTVCQKFLYEQLYMSIARVVLKSCKKVAVVSSTLLYELKLDWMINCMIAVSAPEVVQRERLKQFRGYSDEKIDDIMALHMPVQEKIRRADYWIDATEGEEAIVRNTINLINRKLEAGF